MMAAPWAKKQEVSTFDDIDIDALLSQLTPEEIDQLVNETDPDNSLLPPSERSGNQTTKAPTGPLNRDALLKWLEDKAKSEKDWEDPKPYSKEKRGKVWVAPQDTTKANDVNDDDDDIKTDFDDVLNQATEEELVDLAAALGFHAMLNQDQYNASVEDKPVHGGFKGIAKATVFPVAEMLPPNSTDVDESITKLKSNDSSLVELNLNNIKTISDEKFSQLFSSLESNTTLLTLSCASTGITDKIAQGLLEALKKNSTLKTVIVDSNFIKRDMVVELIQACGVQKSVREISLENQKPALLGVKAEQAIAKAIDENDALEKLGVQFETLNARIRVQEKLQFNYDKHRVRRVEK